MNCMANECVLVHAPLATIIDWALAKWPNKHPLLAYKFNKLILTLPFLLVSISMNNNTQKRRRRRRKKPAKMNCLCIETANTQTVEHSQSKLDEIRNGKQKKEVKKKIEYGNSIGICPKNVGAMLNKKLHGLINMWVCLSR